MNTYIYNLMTNDRAQKPFDIVIKIILKTLSFLYFIGNRVVYLCYSKGIFRTYKIGCPVISVGNITIGGTGKTPTVEMIAEKLTVKKGKKVAILSRGYKADKKSLLADEPKMLSQNLHKVKILVGSNRVENAYKTIKENDTNLILLDDGFQHWRIKKDCNIVNIDSTNPFGNNQLIPRGILREPVSALKRADIFIITKSDYGYKNIIFLRKKLKSLNPKAPIFESRHSPVGVYEMVTTGKPIRNFNRKEEMKTKNLLNVQVYNQEILWKPYVNISNEIVCAVSGIHDARYFENTLKKLGAKVIVNFRFNDHYNYLPDDIENIIQKCKEVGVTKVVTTQKDEVKLKNIVSDIVKKNKDLEIDFMVLRVEIKIDDEDEFFKEIFKRINK